MPPEFGQEQRVAGLKLDHPGAGRGGREARVTRIIGWRAGRHGDRLACQGVVDRPDIEITDRIGRIEGEASSPGHDAGDVVVGVVVAGHAAGIAQPNARPDRRPQQVEPVVLVKAWNIVVDRQRTHVEAGQPGVGGGLAHAIQSLSQGHGYAVEIEPFGPVAIVVATSDDRWTDEHFAHAIGREVEEIGHQVRPSDVGGLHGRPGSAQTRQHDRFATGGEFGEGFGPAEGKSARLGPPRPRRGRRLHAASLSFRSLASAETCLSEPLIA